MICDILNYPIVIISFILIVLGSIYYFNKSNTTTLKDILSNTLLKATADNRHKTVPNSFSKTALSSIFIIFFI